MYAVAIALAVEFMNIYHCQPERSTCTQFKMAVVHQVFEIAQLFEVADPNCIESHSVEGREGTICTGSYKETEFCELVGSFHAHRS